MQVVRRWIPGGDLGTFSTLEAMAELARTARGVPIVRDTALDITRGVTDPVAQAWAIRSWLVGTVQFTRDPTGVELLHSPRYMLSVLRQAGGPIRVDCDDVAVLGAALAGNIGLRARYVAVGFFSPQAPFRHVWTELAPPPGTPWVELDITREAQPLPVLDAIRRTKIVSVF
jgi:hypothetical protein